ncbi:MAG: periplasmic heavy metal sensor [Candidatus Brocadiia bacterium]
MSNKVLSLILIFSLAFNIGFIGIWVYNITVPERRPEPAAEAPPPPWAQLPLQPEQRQSLRAEWQQLLAELEPLRDELRAQRGRLMDLLSAPEPNEAEVRRARERIGELQERSRELVLEHMERTRRALPPRQRKRMFQLLRERSERHRDMFRMHRQHHGRGPWQPPAPPDGEPRGMWIPPERKEYER